MEAFRDHEGRLIRLTDDRLQHIVRRPALLGQQTKIEETLVSPDAVIESRQDPSVRLYHKVLRADYAEGFFREVAEDVFEHVDDSGAVSS